MNQQQPYKQMGVQQPPQRHYHQPVAPHGSNGVTTLIGVLFALMLFALLIVGIVNAHQAVATAGVILAYIAMVVAPIVGIACLAYPAWHRWHMDKFKRKHAELDVQAKEQQMQSDKEAHEMQMYLAQTRLYPDGIGNKPSVFNPRTYEIVEASSGNMPQPVPQHYAPSVHYEYNDKSSQTGIEGQAQNLLAPGSQLALPKIEQFYDAIKFNSQQIGLGLDIETKQLVIAPIRGSVHFKFIGGSGQGKSCVAAGVIDIATTTNDPDHLRLGLLDLEYNTSRLFEDVPHIAEIGPHRQRLIGRNPEEVAEKLKLLQWELKRRSDLGEAHCAQYEPVLLVYVEEMLALKLEVTNKKLQAEMLAAINIVGVRARKYGIFLLACMQTDYSDKSTREAMAQFRTRGGFAIDPDTARAAGFFATELVKQNYQATRQGQYVLEKPSYKGLVLAPDYDVKAKLEMLAGPTTRPTIVESQSHSQTTPKDRVVVTEVPSTTSAPQANGAPLSAQQKRILKKYSTGISINAIIASEFVDGSGKPLAGGRLFAEKAKEIQALIARFLPEDEGDA